MSNSLTTQQRSRLYAAEEKIEKNLRKAQDGARAFLELGPALEKIRSQKLYREKYKTFPAYCEGRWGISKSHAYRLIEAAKFVAKWPQIIPTGDTSAPETEGAARKQLDELKQLGFGRLPPEDQKNLIEQEEVKEGAEAQKNDHASGRATTFGGDGRGRRLANIAGLGQKIRRDLDVKLRREIEGLGPESEGPLSRLAACLGELDACLSSVKDLDAVAA
jgi:hypothetical protein